MWPFGWSRYRIPYRGEPKQNFSKRRKQIRNLRVEKRENVITILTILGLMVVIVGFLILNPSNPNPNRLKQVIIVFIFTLILIMPVAAGLLSINKFRKGYDVDVSEESEKANDRLSEDSSSE